MSADTGTPRREPDRDELTRFLLDLGQGQVDAEATLMPVVYAELKAIAEAYLGRHDSGTTLQPTALVNEAYLKLFDPSRLRIHDRHHFFALAAKSMRQLLVDHARERGAQKRGGGWQRHPLEDLVQLEEVRELDFEDLEAALGKLETLDPRQAEVVQLRFFTGLSIAETAEVLGISRATVEREWTFARAWLGCELADSEG